MEKDNLERIISSKLTNFEVNPPSHVWEAVAAAQRRKVRLFYFRIASAAAVLLLLVALPFMLSRFEPAPLQPSVANTEYTEQSIIAVVNEPYKEKSELINSVQNLIIHSATIQKTNVDVSSGQKISNATELNATSEEFTQYESVAANQTDQEVSEKDETASAQLSPLMKVFDDTFSGFEDANARINGGQFQFAIAYQGIPSGSMSGGDFSIRGNATKFGPDPFQSSMAYRTSFYKEIESTDVRPPLSLGIKVSYYTSARFSVETGLLYTELSTRSKTLEMNNMYHEFEQTLHYIGLPIGMRYDLFKQKSFTIYAAQSVVFEKGLRAVNRVNNYEKITLKSSEKSMAPISGFQLSTLSSAGVDIPLFAGFSFFGEGGFQVFYLNHTQPFNIRSAKPLWPVVHAGVRFKK